MIITASRCLDSSYYHGRVKTEEEKTEQTQSILDMIKFVIDNGADINVNDSGYTVIDLVDNEEIRELLKSKGAEPSYTLIEELYQNDLHLLLWNPETVFNKKYHNLDAQTSIEAKMPYLMHHIWLTHLNSPQEIRSHDLENAIRTKELFAQSNANWTHIIWTNDKNHIPKSVEKLAINQIEVRSIYDNKYNLSLLTLITDLIDQSKWGMASDVLRYAVIEECGGVYSDINYVYNRDVIIEAHKYNFFTSTANIYYIDNFMFGASPNHPIVQETLRLIERNFVAPLPYIANIQGKEITRITDVMTANPIYIAFYSKANLYGNTDVAYPSANPNQDNHLDNYQDSIEELAEWGANLPLVNLMSYTLNHEISGVNRFYIGHAPEGIISWAS